jgi:thioester reductase-like protein
MNVRAESWTRASGSPDANERAVFVTGTTGFLGIEVLARLIEHTDRRIYALVRAPDDRAADRRIRDVLRLATGSDDAADADRVVAVRGDIEQPELGLGTEQRRRLAEQVSDVLHIAATISFTLPLAESRATNVGGTRHALQFAELCQRHGEFGRFSYVSTAYVAGTHRGPFGEDDLDVGQRFHNAYEQTKFEAERLVRRHAGRIPLQVFRPSIIVGDSVTGFTRSFNVIYAPLKTFKRHRIYAVPARDRALLDVVPVDFVADAIVELVQSPGGDRDTYHLVAGPQATTVGGLLGLAGRSFGKRKPPVIPTPIYMRLLHPLILRASSPAASEALQRAEVYFPYLSLGVRYDDARTRPRLARAGIAVKPLEDYFERLMEFAERARWGRLEIPRVRRDPSEQAAGVAAKSGV